MSSNCELVSTRDTTSNDAKETHLEEPRRGDDDHQRICQITHPLLQHISTLGADTRAALQRVRDEHAVVGEEPAALDNVVAAAADEGGTDDADHLGQKVVVLLERSWVLRVGLQLRVGSEEAGGVDGAEQVRV